jgi:hypothetical protein
MEKDCLVVSVRAVTASLGAGPCGILPCERGTFLRLSGKFLKPALSTRRRDVGLSSCGGGNPA